MGSSKSKVYNPIPEKEIATVKSTSAESIEHKLIKKFILNEIPHHNDIASIKEESYLGDHIADLHIKLLNRNDIAVEIQSSYINPKEIIKRNQFYTRKGFYVIWFLYAKGGVVESFRKPKSKKITTISPAEEYLNKIHGNRVYYIDIKKFPPNPKFEMFSLNFSSSKKPFEIQDGRFRKFYYRKVTHQKISGLKLRCIVYKKSRIALIKCN